MSLSFGQWIFAGISLTFGQIIILYSIVIIMACVRKSTGITKLYTKILILIFEWGKKRIRLHEEQLSLNDENSSKEDSDDKNVEESDETEQTSRPSLKIMDLQRSFEELEGRFALEDSMLFMRRGVRVIVDDEVTQRFDAAELSSWNLLTRTNKYPAFISWRLSLLWGVGCILRILILFPFRAVLAIISLVYIIVGTYVIGRIKDETRRARLNTWLMISFYRMLSRSFSSVITFHNIENKAKGGGICVANHTSPIDIIILGCDNCYAMVGQIQGGLFGTVQNAMSRSAHHIWFERKVAGDRLEVARRLREHVENPHMLPILIFPEGTCINNTSLMMFKKGSFEIGGTIYPVAIKYDSRFADPFWNSSKETLTHHIINILTSWALVCDIWYLPPQTRQADETGLEFCNRVKALIAKKGGLVDLEWDGQLKREKPKPALMKKQQEEYSRRIKFE